MGMFPGMLAGQGATKARETTPGLPAALTQRGNIGHDVWLPIMRCNAYTGLRNELYKFARYMNAAFNQLDDCDKITFILSNLAIILCRTSAKTCYQIKCHRKL